MGNRASFHASRAVGPGLSRSRSRLRLFVSVRWSEARPGNSADVVDSATLSQSGWRSETTGGLLSRSVALHSRGREPDGAETRHRPAARFHRARSQHSPPAGKAGSRTPNVGSMKLARLRPSAGLCAGQSMQSAVGPGQCLCSWLLPVSLWRVEASLASSCTNLVPPRGRVGGRLPAVPGLRSVEAVSAASASGPVEGAGLSAWARAARADLPSRSVTDAPPRQRTGPVPAGGSGGSARAEPWSGCRRQAPLWRRSRPPASPTRGTSHRRSSALRARRFG